MIKGERKRERARRETESDRETDRGTERAIKRESFRERNGTGPYCQFIVVRRSLKTYRQRPTLHS